MSFKKIFKPKGLIEQPKYEIFPITKTIQFKTGLDQHVIKKQIVEKMFNEIFLATNFDVVNKPDGTTLMVGRIDIIKMIQENENVEQK